MTSKRKPLEGSDAIIVMDVFLPGEEPFHEEVRLVNYLNNTTSTDRLQVNVRSKLIGVLRKTFGVRVE